MPATGRSPARINADVAVLQNHVDRARVAATAATDDAPSGEDTYREAVAQVARATRELIDYEAQIPELLRLHRQDVDARITRWSGGLLAATCAVAGLVTFVQKYSGWWLVLLGSLLAAGLAVIPGAAQRVAERRVHPWAGAAMFAVAALVGVCCAAGVAKPWLALAALAATWLGMIQFAVIGVRGTPPEAERSTERSTRF
ncbi:MAG TPA: hypothetical protein VFU73_14755 [Actinocrinis sp.]|nr:hypothetical protein [Actinocrinis sp.]